MAHKQISNTFRWQAGCACCGKKEGEPVCEVLLDNFDRANSADLGPDWTITQGAWGINANDAVTSTPNSIALGVPTNPTSYQNVRALVRSLSDGTEARLYLKNDMWVSLKYEFAIYTLAIGQGGAVIREEWVDFQPIDEPFTLFGCYSANNELRGHATNINFTKTYNLQKVTPDNGGTAAGIGCAGVSGTLRMDGFEHWVAQHAGDYSVCPPCQPYVTNCAFCLEEPIYTAPTFIQANVVGLENGVQCTACTDMNGTYTVDHFLDSTCIWRSDIPSSCPDFQPGNGDVFHIEIAVDMTDPVTNKLFVWAYMQTVFNGTQQGILGQWKYYPGIEWPSGTELDPFDCSAMLNGAVLLPVPTEITDPLAPTYCDYETGSTVTLFVP